ncbi:MAG TPA: VOC family protein, partial [Rhodothermales bacterium]|nr:VOC family protein [Rhodothermales bacterium]
KYRLVRIESARYSRLMTSSVRLFRVIMPVPNIEEAARFYSALLDQPGFRVSNGRHYFECGGVILAVYDAKADGDRAAVRSNPEHVYFAVPDLEAFFKRAETVGGLSKEIGDGKLPMGSVARRPWGERSFYMHDLSGNPLCFVDEQSVYRGGPPPS